MAKELGNRAHARERRRDKGRRKRERDEVLHTYANCVLSSFRISMKE